jgi:hypothetical protein
MQFSEAAERVRKQILEQRELIREDVAELLEDYDALADTYQRVMKNLRTPK